MKHCLLLGLLMLIGCKSEPNAVGADSNLTAREMVEQNVFIDLSVQDIQSRAADPIPLRALPAYRAAQYRFEKSVVWDEHQIASTSAKTGADLNMSEELFNRFVADMEWLNDEMRHASEKSNVRRGVRDEAYFDRLLDDADGSKMKQQMEERMQELLNKASHSQQK